MKEELQIWTAGTRSSPYISVCYWRGDALVNAGEGRTAEAALARLAQRLARHQRLRVDNRTGIAGQTPAPPPLT